MDIPKSGLSYIDAKSFGIFCKKKFFLLLNSKGLNRKCYFKECDEIFIICYIILYISLILFLFRYA